MLAPGPPAFVVPGLEVPQIVSSPEHQVLALLVPAPVVVYLAGSEAEGGGLSAAEPALSLDVRCGAALVEQVHVEPAQVHGSMRVVVLEDLFVVLVPIPTDEAKVVTAFVAQQVAPEEASLERSSGIIYALPHVLTEVAVVREELSADVALLGHAQLDPEGSIVPGHDHVEDVS